MASINYRAPPTCARYMRSNAFGRIIAGPVGSGKTTASIVEILRRSIEQKPAEDGYCYTRWAVVRQTLKQLKDTVLKDAQQWLGHVGQWKVSDNTFYIDFDNVKAELIFIPLENAEDQARLLSMQLTGAWLSECIEMNFDVLGPISGRLGRYPSGARGAPTWFGMMADTNMPTELSPWHQFMENLPADWQKFIQPSGLDYPNFDAAGRQIAGAENLNFLVQTDATMKLPLNHPARLAQGRKYYERFLEMYGEDSDWVKRYVFAQYGDDPSGMAVFKQSFKSSFHVAKETLLIPGYPLVVGQDFGRNPWSLICQVDHMGRLVVHQEVAGTNVGLEKHVTNNLRPVLFSNTYMGMKVVLVGDPSGAAKSSISEESNFDCLKRLGLPCFPAVTNDIDPRLRAVDTLFSQQTNGGPSLIINGPACPMLVRALGGGYRYTKTKLGGLRAIPEKNDKEGFSHVVDCLQYVCLVVGSGLVGAAARRLDRGRTPSTQQQIPVGGWT